jgi:hypothetical protein
MHRYDNDIYSKEYCGQIPEDFCGASFTKQYQGSSTPRGRSGQISRWYLLLEGFVRLCKRVVNRPLRENASRFEFSLCLSRVCLGKMIVFSINTSRKMRIPHLREAVRGAAACGSVPTCSRERPFCLNCSYICPDPVLVNVRF